MLKCRNESLTELKVILSSRITLLNVILKNIFAAFECDPQKRILVY